MRWIIPLLEQVSIVDITSLQPIFLHWGGLHCGDIIAQQWKEFDNIVVQATLLSIPVLDQRPSN